MTSGLFRIAAAIGIVTVLGACAWFIFRAVEGSPSVQTTDNAYVRGEITALSARVTGYAIQVLADDDMAVKAKQVIVRIDPRDYKAALDKAQASLDQMKAALIQVGARRDLERSKIAVAEANLKSAEAQGKNADITLRRATELFQKGAGTEAKFDDATASGIAAQATTDQARANLEYERQQLIVLDSDEATAKAQVASAEAALVSARNALEDTEVWAPIGGVVANRKTRIGEYVTAGTRMLSIVPTDNLWIEANYRETQIAKMKPNDPVRVAIDIFPDKPVCGYVESISPASGSEFALIPPDNATGNFTKIVRRFTVRIRPNAREKNAGLLRPGSSVEVSTAAGGDGTVSERARRLNCDFDPTQDVRERLLVKLPNHPGLSLER